jgi:HSP20 family protein
VHDFDPLRDLNRLTSQLAGMPLTGPRSPRLMAMDLFRTGDHYILNADLPGVDPGSIDISVENGVLTLTAERSARTGEDVGWVVGERFTGVYQRQFTLGDSIDTERISASYDNGVLSLTIPVAERAKPRRIRIETGGSVQIEQSEDRGSAHRSDHGVDA